jgi:hypothetical protein
MPENIKEFHKNIGTGKLTLTFVDEILLWPENLLHVKLQLNFGSLPKKHFTTQETEGLHRTVYNDV